MVKRNARDTVLKDKPLHNRQQAYRVGGSVESALIMVETRIGQQIEAYGFLSMIVEWKRENSMLQEHGC